jgi:peptidyl-prolyl cis-trans isomerase D
MLQAIHDNLKGVFAMVILGVLAVVFVFWGVEFVSVGGLTATQGIEVNGESVDTNEVRQAYQEELTRYQVALGGAEMPGDLREQLRQQVLDGAVRSELVRQRTDDLRFRATDADVLELLREIPAFQVDGKFSKDAYYAALRSANLEPVSFEAQQKQLVAARQLDRGIFASAFVLPQEFERREALLNERREIAWVVLPAGRFLAASDPDDAALAAYFELNKDRYQTEERVNLQYVELELAGLAVGVAATEEALRAFYEESKDRYTTAERRRARHILILSEGDDAAAEARARAAYQRAAAGEDFALLAAELSKDPGSAAQGGDLGWAEQSFFVGPFGEAVWSMQPGEVKGPVKTEFGWHVVRLEGIEPGQEKSFDTVRAELETEFRRAEAERLFGDLQEQLDTVAFEATGDLQRVAESLALEVKSVESFTRSGGGALGASPDLVKAVFQPEVLNGSQLATVQLDPGRVAAVKVAAHEPPRGRPLEEVRAAVVVDLKADVARQEVAKRAKALVDELRAGAAWGGVAQAWAPAAEAGPGGLAPRYVRRGDATVPAEVGAAAFKAASGTGGAPVYGTATLPAGDVAVWALTGREPGSPARLSPAERAEAMRNAREQSSFHDASVYVTELRSKAKVEVNPQLFE